MSQEDLSLGLLLCSCASLVAGCLHACSFPQVLPGAGPGWKRVGAVEAISSYCQLLIIPNSGCSWSWSIKPQAEPSTGWVTGRKPHSSVQLHLKSRGGSWRSAHFPTTLLSPSRCGRECEVPTHPHAGHQPVGLSMAVHLLRP